VWRDIYVVYMRADVRLGNVTVVKESGCGSYGGVTDLCSRESDFWSDSM